MMPRCGDSVLAFDTLEFWHSKRERAIETAGATTRDDENEGRGLSSEHRADAASHDCMVGPREASLCRQVLINMQGKDNWGQVDESEFVQPNNKTKKWDGARNSSWAGKRLAPRHLEMCSPGTLSARVGHRRASSGRGGSRCSVLVRGGGGATAGPWRWIGTRAAKTKTKCDGARTSS